MDITHARGHRQTSLPVLTSDLASRLSVLTVASQILLETEVGIDMGTIVDVSSGAGSQTEVPVGGSCGTEVVEREVVVADKILDEPPDDTTECHAPGTLFTVEKVLVLPVADITDEGIQRSQD